jgi:hypothetical protein
MTISEQLESIGDISEVIRDALLRNLTVRYAMNERDAPCMLEIRSIALLALV